MNLFLLRIQIENKKKIVFVFGGWRVEGGGAGVSELFLL